MDFNKLLDRLDFWISESDKWQKAVDEFCKIIAPASYSPIVEERYVEAFINGVCSLQPELKEDLEYYAYEAKGMEKATILYQEKEYDACKREEFVNYLAQAHPKCFTFL